MSARSGYSEWNLLYDRPHSIAYVKERRFGDSSDIRYVRVVQEIGRQARNLML
jgi:hypothetical protein